MVSFNLARCLLDSPAQTLEVEALTNVLNLLKIPPRLTPPRPSLHSGFFVQVACIAFEIRQASCAAHYSFVKHVVQATCLKCVAPHALTLALQFLLSILHFPRTRIQPLSSSPS